MTPLFTVVIPIYNSSKYIGRTLESIKFATRHKNYEIILVDDCSNDIDKIYTLIKDDSKIKIIYKEQKTNAANSRNLGYLLSTSRFVFFLDSDDSYLPGAIDKRLLFHKNNHVGVAFGNFITNFGDFKKKSNLPYYNSQDMRDYIFVDGGDCRSSAISIDKNFYKLTMFDNKSYKHQDWIFAIRCSDNKEVIMFDVNEIAYLNIGRTNRMSSSFNIKASEYLCEEYLKSKKYINLFLKRNWVQAILSKDKEAYDFFVSQFKATNKTDHLKYLLVRILSREPVYSIFSSMLYMLRELKQRYL